MKEKKEIAVIGDENFRLGFELAGVQKTFGCESYKEKIEELIESEELGIIVAERKDIEDLPERTQRKVESSVEPVVVVLSEDKEDSNLQEQIRKVIGADIS